MATVDESLNADSQINQDLAALRELSLNQQVTFSQYIRQVLPLDGFVFWLRTQRTTIQGSLHISIDKQQSEDESPAVNQAVFTTDKPVQLFNAISSDTMLVGEFEGAKFAFSRRESFYRAAGLYHYVGTAVYPALQNQLVDVGAQIADTTPIISNSLPAWLALKSYKPIWLLPANPELTLYPSFAVPDNLQPPYGSVHIEPTATRALGATAVFAQRGTQSQLATDHVRVTLYGAPNNVAMDWLALVNSYSTDTDIIGMMNMPIIRDEKRTQPELNILAMKKTIEFDVSYLQKRIDDVARQLILHASVLFIPGP